MSDEAKKRVQLRLALETIAKKENIEVTDADLDEALQQDGRNLQGRCWNSYAQFLPKHLHSDVKGWKGS